MALAALFVASAGAWLAMKPGSEEYAPAPRDAPKKSAPYTGSVSPPAPISADAEQQRIAEEQQRIAEEQRRAAEVKKAEAEVKKAEAEVKKAEAEVKKLAEAETKKVLAENKRKSEEARKLAEESRKAEDHRRAEEQRRQQDSARLAEQQMEAAKRAAAEREIASAKQKEMAAKAAGPVSYAQALALLKEGETAEGVRLLRAAAHAGNGQAAKLLGDLYDSGQGVPMDRHEARRYYDLAESLGAYEPLATRRRGVPSGSSPVGPKTAREPSLPDFPWPPPRPSSQVVLNKTLFKIAQGATTLAALNTQVENALRQAKYEYSYYRAPNGFALVTRLERIDVDGTPQPEEFRFLVPGSREPFTLANYIRQLFFAPAGLYRLIVFVVTDQPFVASGERLSSPAAADLLAKGSNQLSDDFKGASVTSNHSVTALIYEFEKASSQQDASTLTPGRLSANTHLQRAKILPVLESR